MEAEALEDSEDPEQSFDDTSGAERHRPFPRAFGRYILLHSLAEGGMGEVFFAKTRMLGDSIVGVGEIEKSCIVKTLRGHLTSDREYVARFIDEARLVVQLNHRNVCHVFDVGRVGTRYYLAMEYIPGRDVRTLAQRAAGAGKPLPEPMALFIASEILEALDYAHRRVNPQTGAPLLLVHRDVSPQNVMVSFEGEVKLIDFGLAASTMKKEHTKPEVVMGKLAYMSPEQARGDEVDASTDQFAAAIVAYELITGERFYGDMPQHEVWFAAGRGGFKPPHWDKLHPTVARVIQKALHQQPWNRFASCGDMKEEIQRILVERKMRVTARDLRLFMEDIFQADIGQQQQLLESMTNKPVTPPPQAEPSMSIAQAPRGKEVAHERSEATQISAHVEDSVSIASAATIRGAPIALPTSSDGRAVDDSTESGNREVPKGLVAAAHAALASQAHLDAPMPPPMLPPMPPPASSPGLPVTPATSPTAPAPRVERTQLVRRDPRTADDGPAVSVFSAIPATSHGEPKRTIPLVAVLVIAAAVAGIATFLLLPRDPAARGVEPAPIAATLPPPTLTPTPPVVSPTPPVVATPVPPVVAPPPPPVATPTPPIATPTPPIATPTPPVVVVKQPTPPPTVQDKKPKPKPKPAPRPTPPTTGTATEKVAYLGKHCREERCTATTSTPKKAGAKPTLDELQSWIVELDKCLKQCTN